MFVDSSQGAKHLLPHGPQLYDSQHPHTSALCAHTPPGCQGIQGHAPLHMVYIGRKINILFCTKWALERKPKINANTYIYATCWHKRFNIIADLLTYKSKAGVGFISKLV